MSESDVVAKTVVVTISLISLTSAATSVSAASCARLESKRKWLSLAKPENHVMICHSMIISTDWASFRILHADTSDQKQ